VSSSLAATETGCLHAVDNIDDDAISLTGEGATEEEEEEGNGNLTRPMEIEDHLMQMEKDLTAKTEEDDGEKRVGEPKKEKKDRRVALLPPPALSSTSKGAPIPRIVIPDGDDDVEQSEQPSSWPSRSGGTIENGNGESRWKRIVVIEGEKRRHGSRWPLADIILVYEHFRGRRNLSAEGIRVELASNAALRKLMRRRGFLSCYDKIKAMWAASASFFDQEPFN